MHSKDKEIKLDIGCGKNKKEGFIGIDIDPKSGADIIASALDLPSIREILNEKNSFLVKPNDPKELANGIKNILQNKELGNKIATKAYSDVQKYTWDERVQNILNFILK